MSSDMCYKDDVKGNRKMRYTFNLFLGFFLLGGLCFTANSVNGKEPIEEPTLGVNIVGSEGSAQAEMSAHSNMGMGDMGMGDMDMGGRFQSNAIILTTGTERTASCVDPFCDVAAPAFSSNPRTIWCLPSATSNTCTIEITFCGQFVPNDASTDDDNLAMRFLIDEGRANPGPTDENGFVSLKSPLESGRETNCISVTDTGKEAGPHNVNVQFAVEDLSGDGSNVSLKYAHLMIQVYQP